VRTTPARGRENPRPWALGKRLHVSKDRPANRFGRHFYTRGASRRAPDSCAPPRPSPTPGCSRYGFRSLAFTAVLKGRGDWRRDRSRAACQASRALEHRDSGRVGRRVTRAAWADRSPPPSSHGRGFAPARVTRRPARSESCRSNAYFFADMTVFGRSTVCSEGFCFAKYSATSRSSSGFSWLAKGAMIALRRAPVRYCRSACSR
jgi:hypothetical protein